MAEFVLKRAEEMLPEFEQMERVGLFSDHEIKSIIKKTRNHEYKLVRRTKDKKDFLSYIQYKIHLLSLIGKRRKKSNYFFKKDEIEFAIVARIHRLFKQCTFRWPEDLKLWLSHIDFCKHWNKKVQLSKIWTTMLQMHGNTKVHLWAMAAKWELEENNSVENARSIFLRGIRHHPEKTKLWHEYFRMELIHVLKTRQRLALLNQQTEDHDEKDSDTELLRGAAAQIVYENSLKAINENNIEFKCSFLKIALEFSFFAGELINMIVDDIAENHSDVPMARSTLARLHMNSHMQIISDSTVTETNSSALTADSWAAERRCLDEFETAISEVDTTEMWGEYFSFLSERIMVIDLCHEGGFELSGTKSKSRQTIDEMRLEKFLDVAKRACEHKHLSADNIIIYVIKLLELGKVDEAYDVLITSNSYLSSIDLKIKLLQVTVQHKLNVLCMEDVTSSFMQTSILSGKMSPEQDKIFWSMWLELAGNRNDEKLLWQIVELAEKFNSPSVSWLKSCILEWYAKEKDVDACFDMYKSKFPAKPDGLQVTYKMIELLNSSLTRNLKGIEFCFEQAVDVHGKHNPDLWLDYLSHMLKTDPEKVGRIHWRAMKYLKPELTEKFVTGYTLLHIKQSGE